VWAVEPALYERGVATYINFRRGSKTATDHLWALLRNASASVRVSEGRLDLTHPGLPMTLIGFSKGGTALAAVATGLPHCGTNVPMGVLRALHFVDVGPVGAVPTNLAHVYALAVWCREHDVTVGLHGTSWQWGATAAHPEVAQQKGTRGATHGARTWELALIASTSTAVGYFANPCPHACQCR